MTKTSPFSHEPDAELGRLLHEALSGTDDPAFANRVMAGFDEAQRLGPPFVDVLAMWSRVGVAAAVALAVAGLLMLRPLASGTDSIATSLDDLLADESIPAALVSVPSPDPNVVLAAAMDR